MKPIQNLIGKRIKAKYWYITNDGDDYAQLVGTVTQQKYDRVLVEVDINNSFNAPCTLLWVKTNKPDFSILN